MTKVTLTSVYRSDKDKNGNKLISKQGKPFTRLSIKCQEYGDKWLSGFDNKVTSNWKEGDTVEIEITQNGEYLNFSIPNKEEQTSRVIEFLKDDLQTIKTECQMIRGQIVELIDYLKKNQIAFGSTKVGVTGNVSSAYPQPTPSEHNAMQNNNHFSGGLGYNDIDDTGRKLDENIPF